MKIEEEERIEEEKRIEEEERIEERIAEDFTKGNPLVRSTKGR